MPLQIIRNDITKMEVDAIVNATDATLSGSGGVDGAIHQAAGGGLLSERLRLGGCRPGQARITGGHKLPCKYVIHTVGPRWGGGQNGERQLLESCYHACLRLALKRRCRSVAFPLISSGTYGYPKDQALRVAVDCITAFLAEHDILVYLVVFDRASFQISEKLFSNIAAFIDDTYVEAYAVRDRSCQITWVKRDAVDAAPAPFTADAMPTPQAPFSMPQASSPAPQASFPAPQASFPAPQAPSPALRAARSLEDAVGQLDESFSQMLLRKIDEKGMTDSQCYKKANVDRKLFSKIRSDTHYHPSKTTAIAFAIALELSLEDTKELLQRAGFALTHSSKFDIIIEYFIQNGNYNVFEINEALFAFDQALLGG